MRTLFLSLILLLVVSASFSQKVVQSYICAGVGPSIPFNHFADRNYKNEEAGFAHTGPSLSFQGVYFFDPFIGIGGSFGLAAHMVDETSFENAIVEYNEDVANVRITSSTPYTHLYTAIGFYFNIPLIDNLHITPKILGGVMATVGPEFYLDIYYKNGTQESGVTNVAAAVSILPIFGGAIRYKATKRLMLNIDIERFSVNHKFIYEDSGPDYAYEQKISFVNVLFGAGIVF